jgi:hypothetical protein
VPTQTPTHLRHQASDVVMCEVHVPLAARPEGWGLAADDPSTPPHQLVAGVHLPSNSTPAHVAAQSKAAVLLLLYGDRGVGLCRSTGVLVLLQQVLLWRQDKTCHTVRKHPTQMHPGRTHLLKHEGQAQHRHTMKHGLHGTVQATVGDEGTRVWVAQHILQHGRARKAQPVHIQALG